MDMYRVKLRELATQHYISAKLNFSQRLTANLGITYHRAFELLFKAALIKAWADQKETEQSIVISLKKHRHDLPKLLKSFSAVFNQASSREEMAMAEVLQFFEKHRYPDEFLKLDSEIHITGNGGPYAEIKFEHSSNVMLVINVDQLEPWWISIHRAAGFNLKSYGPMWGHLAKSLYSSVNSDLVDETQK